MEGIRHYSCEYIKEYADIYDVARALGLEMQKKGGTTAIRCVNPDHQDAHIGNCILYPTSVHCFACGAHYDVIGLTRAVTGYRLDEALNLIADICHIPEPETGHTGRNTSIFQPQSGFISKEDREFIGIHNSPFYKMRMRSEKEIADYYFDAIDKGEKPNYQQWEQECVSSSPLKDLFLHDRPSYQQLICDKVKEKAYNLKQDYKYLMALNLSVEMKNKIQSDYLLNLRRCSKILQEAKK